MYYNMETFFEAIGARSTQAWKEFENFSNQASEPISEHFENWIKKTNNKDIIN